MSGEVFFDLCDNLLKNEESVKKRYFEFVRIELNHLRILKEENIDLKEQFDEIKKENNKNKIKKDKYKSKYKQLLQENENLKKFKKK